MEAAASLGAAAAVMVDAVAAQEAVAVALDAASVLEELTATASEVVLELMEESSLRLESSETGSMQMNVRKTVHGAR